MDNTSTAAITKSSALPVFVTNDALPASLPSIFKAGASLFADALIATGLRLMINVHEVQGEWIRCDYSASGAVERRNEWLLVTSFSGFAWGVAESA